MNSLFQAGLGLLLRSPASQLVRATDSSPLHIALIYPVILDLSIPKVAYRSPMWSLPPNATIS